MVSQSFWESHIFCRLFLSHNCNAVGGTLQLSASKKVHRIFQECAVCKRDKNQASNQIGNWQGNTEGGGKNLCFLISKQWDVVSFLLYKITACQHDMKSHVSMLARASSSSCTLGKKWETDRMILEEGKFGMLLMHIKVWENGACWKVPPPLSRIAWGMG